MSTHVRILGWLHLIYGALGLCMAFLVFAGSMVGALFSGSVMGMLGAGFGGAFAAAFIALLSVPGLVAGYGLLKFRPWARTLTIVLAVFELDSLSARHDRGGVQSLGTAEQRGCGPVPGTDVLIGKRQDSIAELTLSKPASCTSEHLGSARMSPSRASAQARDG